MLKNKNLKIGSYLYNKKNKILFIDCDKLLFLKKYKNIQNIIKLKTKEKRIYIIIYYFLKFRVKYLCQL